jgi:hypothetical protein
MVERELKQEATTHALKSLENKANGTILATPPHATLP